MSKSNKSTPAVATPAVAAPVQYIQLTGKPSNYKAGSARDVWFQLVAQYDGKPLAEFVAAGTASPPSLPTKGKSAGKLESVPGWVTFFAKPEQGLVTLVTK
jgi:hypothetical protein